MKIFNYITAVLVTTNAFLSAFGQASADRNFVRKTAVTIPGVTLQTQVDALSNSSRLQTVDYYDGLGRPLQSVSVQMSPGGKDIILPIEHDGFGRQVKEYLPYTDVSGAAYGSLRSGAYADQANFYSVSNTNFPNVVRDASPYSQTFMEFSPLGRPLEEGSPGQTWQPGNGHGATQRFSINAVADSVHRWTIATTAGSFPATTTLYAAGELMKTIATNESGQQVVEFKDKEERVILKKVRLLSAGSQAHYGWLCTYFVYDDFSHLRSVIQPKAVEWLMVNSWAFTGTYGVLAANELCFRYEYDQRHRLIIKKNPGTGEIWMVYDGRDRLIMTQDGNQRVQTPLKWSVIEYDSLNRPYRTGLLTDANNRTYHQNLAYNSISYPATSSNYEVLTQTYYDDYSWVSGTGAGLGTSMASNHSTDATYFYTTYNAAPAYALPLTPFMSTRGMSTGNASKVLGSTSTYLYSVNFYDDHGRAIQSQSTNYRGGIDTITVQYNFSGKPLRTLLGHRKGGIGVQNHTVLTKASYDAALRLKNVLKNIDGTGDQLIDSVQYNELGQMKGKYLGNNVDSLIYAYGIRGWLTSINKSYLTSSNPKNYFGMELGYDKATDATGNSYATPAFNGNVSGMVWKSGGDGMARKYDFTYDNVNRLTGADYNQFNGTTFDKSAGVDFSVSGLSYDANGNILSMKQRGLLLNSSATIDSLTYTYMYNGINNRLQGVVDGANNPNSQLGDLHYNPNGKGGVDYTYDGNGNAKTDYNRGIDSINYNCLNLPQQVHVKGKGWINYTYDASGNKLAKQTMDSLSRHATTTVYLNEFVYQHNDTITTPNAGTDTLQFISHEEGRVRWAFHKYLNGSTKYKWEYDFFEKDHLGNIREVLTQEKDTTLYKATMEAAYRATENALFYNIPQTCIGSYYVYGASQPYPSDPNATVPNDSVSRLNGNTPKEGPAIILKVMAGDVFDVSVNALYRSGQTSTGTTDALSDILSALANGLVTVTGGAKGSYSTLSNTTTSPLLPAVNTFRSGNTPTPAVNPKAYLNYMVLDDQFNYDASVSGAIPVNGPDVLLPPLARSGIKIKKNGFLYIYLTNETKNVNVIFDNLSVVHYTGPLLEETHYYPFGLTMAGISDKALKNQYAGNKYKFNGGNELQNQEFSDGSGLEVYDANFRGYDPQIGRFLQQDPLTNAEESWSPYTFVGDNPISFNDPLGLSGQTDDLKGDGEEVLPKIKPKPKPKIKFKTLETAYVVGYKKGCISCKAPFGAGAFPLPMLRPPSPLIVVPETTPGPPGRVIPFNPLPGIGTGIAVEEETSTGLSLLGILGRTFGTIGLVFLPTSAPAEGLHWQPYNSHSNKKDNSNPHIVYVFGFGAKDGKTPILKYGISDEYKWSMDRPENQIDGLRKKYGPTVMYTIYARVINREAASALEAKLTLEHIAIWGDRPREQRRP